jgi:hypothetical protein
MFSMSQEEEFGHGTWLMAEAGQVDPEH